MCEGLNNTLEEVKKELEKEKEAKVDFSLKLDKANKKIEQDEVTINDCEGQKALYEAETAELDTCRRNLEETNNTLNAANKKTEQDEATINDCEGHKAIYEAETVELTACRSNLTEANEKLGAFESKTTDETLETTRQELKLQLNHSINKLNICLNQKKKLEENNPSNILSALDRVNNNTNLNGEMLEIETNVILPRPSELVQQPKFCDPLVAWAVAVLLAVVLMTVSVALVAVVMQRNRALRRVQHYAHLNKVLQISFKTSSPP